MKFTLEIKDELQKKMKADAQTNKRSIAKQYEWIIEKYYEEKK